MRLHYALVVLLSASCTSGAGPEGPANNVAANNVSANNIAQNAEPGPMMLPTALRETMDENCLSCHSPGGIAPFDFTDVQTVVSLGELIGSTVQSRTMPPWNIDPTCADLKGDLRLSDDQIAIFTEWVADGKPLVPEAPFERVAAKNPEIGDPPSDSDEIVDAMIPAAYNPVFGRSAAYQNDDFRCFVIDPGFTVDRQMTGFEVLVDNVELAHHMVVYTADGGENSRAEIAALEAEDEQPGFSCFGVGGFDLTGLIAAWAPGGGRVGFPQRQAIGQTAVPIEAGSLIVVQMHYNKTAADAGTDQSGIRLWFRPDDAPVNELAEAYFTFVGNEPFRVPAGVDGTDVPDDECDIVYNTYNLDDVDDSPDVSAPRRGYHGDELKCGLRVEDCEAENGLGAATCAIDYSTRLQITNPDMSATYSVTIAGTTLSYDAASNAASSATQVLDGIVDAINNEPALSGIVTAIGRDTDGDTTTDEVIVSNVDGEAALRTESFTATGEATVRQRLADGCAQWDATRLVEARNVGASGCVQQEIYYRNPGPLKIWAAFSHMHLVGKRIEIEVMSSSDDGTVSVPAEEPECLARTNSWDFDWQRTYWFQEPKHLPRNGMVRLRCRYDNSDSGTEVRLGDGSGSEMCLGLVYLTL